LICDGCFKGFHTYCVDLTDVPSGDWCCNQCTSRQNMKNPKSSRPPTEPASETSSEQNEDNTLNDSDQENLSEDLEEDEFGPLSKDIWEDEAALYYIKTSSHHTARLPLIPHLRRKEIKRIEKRASSYHWDPRSSTLFKTASGRHSTPRPCPPLPDRANIIKELHCELGHVGSARLASIISTRYWWPGITTQVKAAVRSCTDCLRNRALFRQETPLQPLPLPDGLFERVHLDSAGPYPRSRNGNTYIYLAVCATSKYPIAMAAPKLSASDFAAFFMLHVVAQHGVPATVVHDSGPEFGEPWSTCLRELGVEQRRSSAYHPNTNGQAESMVKQVLHSLQRMINEDGSPDTWDERLPMALLGLRTAPNASTKHSPAYVVYGRHLCLPAQRRRLPTTQLTDKKHPRTQTAEACPRQQEDSRRRPPRLAAAGAAIATAAVAALDSSQESDLFPHAKPSKLKSRASRQLKLEEDPKPTSANLPKASPSVIEISSEDTTAEDTSSEGSLEEGTKALMRQRKAQHLDIQQQLRRNVKHSQEKMKRDHSRRKHSTKPSSTMPPNSLVLMKAPASSKLSKGVEGPFLLIRYNTGQESSAAGAAGPSSTNANPETRALLQDGASKRWWVSVTRITPYSTQQ